MTYKITLSSGYNYQVKLKKQHNYKFQKTYTLSEEVMPSNLNDLLDVEITGNPDKYVLMYDATSGKWKNKNPDEVLSASSTTESTSPGLPSDFIDELDVDLDNRIDLDAGTF